MSVELAHRVKKLLVRPLIDVTSFAIHVTYTCPLACAHCCFSSNPQNKDRLDIPFILESIRGLKGLGLNMIALTGGEPFLLGKHLEKVVADASTVCSTVRVVTSAHWATTDAITTKWLTGLKAAGLTEMSISWDDYHEEFVDFSNVRRAFSTGKKLGLTVAISIVQSATSRWTATRVRDELGLTENSDDTVVESPLNLTGRADKELRDAGLRRVRYVGPCPYVITGPTLSAKGKLLACCGVIPHTEELVIDSNPTLKSIPESIEKSQRSALLNWLHLRGPYAIMEYISKKFDVEIPPKESLGGNCEACKVLFETPNISRHIARAATNKAEDIGGELAVLQTLGMLNNDEVMKLWSGGSTITDVSNY